MLCVKSSGENRLLEPRVDDGSVSIALKWVKLMLLGSSFIGSPRVRSKAGITLWSLMWPSWPQEMPEDHRVIY